MIVIKHAPQKAHPNTDKTVSFTAKKDPAELIQQIKDSTESLAKNGYIFPNVSFLVEESDFEQDRAICTIRAGRMETKDECDKRVERQVQSNARELQTLKERLYIQQKRKEFNRLTDNLSLEQLQALSSLGCVK